MNKISRVEKEMNRVDHSDWLMVNEQMYEDEIEIEEYQQPDKLASLSSYLSILSQSSLTEKHYLPDADEEAVDNQVNYLRNNKYYKTADRLERLWKGKEKKAIFTKEQTESMTSLILAIPNPSRTNVEVLIFLTEERKSLGLLKTSAYGGALGFTYILYTLTPFDFGATFAVTSMTACLATWYNKSTTTLDSTVAAKENFILSQRNGKLFMKLKAVPVNRVEELEDLSYQRIEEEEV